MTHDELLAKIDYWFDTDNFHLHKNALRAVVELHKPNPEGDECSYCGWECGGELVSFPCDTIKTIEKELM
jgi:hypothetical protein